MSDEQMPRTRAQLLQLMLAHEAAAAACKAALRDEAAELFTKHGSADTWRLPGGQVITSQTHDRASIVDEPAFLAYLAKVQPHQVTTRTVTEPVNRKWVLEEFLPALQPLDPDELEAGEQTQLMDAEGTLVPGVTWAKGGGLSSVTVRPDSAVTRRLRAAAEAYAAGRGRTMPELGA